MWCEAVSGDCWSSIVLWCGYYVDPLWHVDGDMKLDRSLHANGDMKSDACLHITIKKLLISFLQQTIGGQDAWAFHFSAGLGVSTLWSSWLISCSVLGPAS